MRMTIKVPKLGLTTETVAIQEWSKQIGEPFQAGEVIAILEADKATIEVPAPMGGTLIEVLAHTGTEVAVGDPIAVIQTA